MSTYFRRGIHTPPRLLSEAIRLPSWGQVGIALASLSLLLLGLSPSVSLSQKTASVPASVSAKVDAFLSPKLREQAPKGWASVIVQMEGELTTSRRAELQALKADIYRNLSIIQSVAVKVPNRNLAKLASLAWVKRLSSDVAVQKNDDFTVNHTGADVAFEQSNLTGLGVTVAVVDSGIMRHNDDLEDSPFSKQSRILTSVNFVPYDNKADDECGHGTHVAGIIAGNGKYSTDPRCFRPFYGIARRANLVNVRVLDDYGQGTVSSVIAGIQWVLANKAAYNIRVMNLSLGHPVGESYTTDPLCQAVKSAWEGGLFVVCAAGNMGRLQNSPDPTLGNEGYGTNYASIQSPGNSPYVMTVGAMKKGLVDGTPTGGDIRTTALNASDRIATYSSRGPSRLDFVLKPDIVAPGNRVISLQANNSYLQDTYAATNSVPLSEFWYGYNGTSICYMYLSGTSMAAPVVAGAAALMLEVNPNLSPDTLKARLMISADKWQFADGTADALTFGAGYLNIPAALASTVVAQGPAVSPTVYCDRKGNVLIDSSKAVWGNKAIWGTGISDLKAIWGTNAIWGTSTLSSSKAVWGNNLIWGDNAIWGVNTGAVDLSNTAIYGE